jgi:uncharacterized metal-binding protein
MECALCKTKDCSRGVDCTSIRSEVIGAYKDAVLESARNAAFIEATYYMQKTRIEEAIEFAKLMAYKRIGIAFCIGLAAEAETIHRILGQHFEISSVCCKVCGIPKQTLGLKPLSGEDDEAMCNPVGQARVLNDKHTDLNLIVGLCMGHDIIFTRHSEAPVSTLIAKDRVLTHNPAGAIYSRYYLRRLLEK